MKKIQRPTGESPTRSVAFSCMAAYLYHILLSMQRSITLLTLFFLFHAISAQSTKRALFIGNSYTATNNLPQLIADVAESAGDTLIFSSNAPGGYTFEMHTTNATTQALIAEGTWDYVVLQEQSQIPSWPIEQVEVECFPFATQLDSMVKAGNDCTETMFFMTWGRRDGDAANCPFWPPVCTYAGMDSLLQERYLLMGEYNNAEVSPVAAVWHYIRDHHPEIELYNGDGSHPSPSGSYAAACTFYTALFRADPSLITFDYSLTASDAAAIREAAKLVLYDSLSNYFIGTYVFEPIASFTTNTEIPLTATFTNTSSGASTYFWQFGDGNTSTSMHPTHTYSTAGAYSVTLTATICGVEHETTQTIEVLAADPSSVHTSDFDCMLMPNPVSHTLFIHHIPEVEIISMMDISGRKMYMSANYSGGVTSIDVSTLEPGMYLLVAQKQTDVAYLPFIKQ